MCKKAWVTKKHCCQQRACFTTNAIFNVRNCADQLRSEISSRALATSQNIEKTRKQEAIWIKCAYLLSVKFFLKENPVCNCCRNINFLYGVERGKRSVYVHLHCIVNKLKKIGLSKMSTLLPPGKISADAHVQIVNFDELYIHAFHVCICKLFNVLSNTSNEIRCLRFNIEIFLDICFQYF